ncbi:MAG TPA: prepilin-type N-terminal cleavage/methylation domain-containing protein [Terriglobia bacterium]|jgi:type II secretion system protein I
MSGRTKQAGFTLLEVLVATAIVGTAVAALLSLLSGALGNVRRLQAPEQALLLARSQLNEALIRSDRGRSAEPVLRLDQKIDGRWDEQYRWEMQATRFRSSPQPVPGEAILVRITCDVFWISRTGERKLTLETYQIWEEPAPGAQVSGG